MNKMISLAILGSTILAMAGCQTLRTANFSVVSTKAFTFTRTTNGLNVTAENCGFSLLLMPITVPFLQPAIDRALAAAGPEYNALINVEVYQTTGVFSNCYKIKGMAINTKLEPINKNDPATVLYRSTQKEGLVAKK